MVTRRPTSSSFLREESEREGCGRPRRQQYPLPTASSHFVLRLLLVGTTGREPCEETCLFGFQTLLFYLHFPYFTLHCLGEKGIGDDGGWVGKKDGMNLDVTTAGQPYETPSIPEADISGTTAIYLPYLSRTALSGLPS